MGQCIFDVKSTLGKLTRRACADVIETLRSSLPPPGITASLRLSRMMTVFASSSDCWQNLSSSPQSWKLWSRGWFFPMRPRAKPALLPNEHFVIYQDRQYTEDSIWWQIKRYLCRPCYIRITTVGGRDGSIGVRGLILGGGVFYYTGTRGFAGDSVINFEVFLANGTDVDANTWSFS